MNNGNSLSGRVFLSVAVALLIASCGGGGGNGGGGSGVGGNGGGTAFTWLIPENEIFDGGPGKDGIPAIDQPEFESASTIASVGADDFVVVVRYAGTIKVYPHDIMDWHEVVNDGDTADPFSMSYCPLTGSAVAWQGDPNAFRRSFGVSGLLYNSNLILYDRKTDSYWSQMLQKSVRGSRAGEFPQRIQVLEMTFAALQQMFPDAQVMTRNTGWNRDYDMYPYGFYRTHEGLLFPVSRTDNRLHLKTRVIGIYSATDSKVYQIGSFGGSTQTINDQFENQSIVAVGNSTLNFAAIFSRELSDGTILAFNPIQDDLPNVMSDDEGNTWDVFGTATSGPREGAQLEMTQSYSAYWFAFATFFADPQIHFN
jgi:hypothetical protein